MPFGTAVGQGFNNGEIFQIDIVALGPADGLFFYDPVPGFGNLVGSISFFGGTSGVDEYGNTVYPGFQSYTAAGGHTGINNGIVTFAGSSAVMPATIQTSVTGGLLSLSSGGTSTFDNAGSIAVESAAAGGTGQPVLDISTNSVQGAINMPQAPPASPGSAPAAYSQSFEQTNYTGGLNDNIATLRNAGVYT